MDYTITYFRPIPSTGYCTKAKSELVNIPLVSPPVNFYTLLPVSIHVAFNLKKKKIVIYGTTFRLKIWDITIIFEKCYYYYYFLITLIKFILL